MKKSCFGICLYLKFRAGTGTGVIDENYSFL